VRFARPPYPSLPVDRVESGREKVDTERCSATINMVSCCSVQDFFARNISNLNNSSSTDRVSTIHTKNPIAATRFCFLAIRAMVITVLAREHQAGIRSSHFLECIRAANALYAVLEFGDPVLSATSVPLHTCGESRKEDVSAKSCPCRSHVKSN
jgi:hypothetical protein